MKTHKYNRSPFQVDAIQVTAENHQEVSDWCDGKIVPAEPFPYIKVKVHQPRNEKQSRAYVSDWILKSATGYKIYTNKAFQKAFYPDPEPLGNIFENHPEEVPEGDMLDFEVQAAKTQPTDPRGRNLMKEN